MPLNTESASAVISRQWLNSQRLNTIKPLHTQKRSIKKTKYKKTGSLAGF